MRNVPVWVDDTPIRKFPKLQRNISADVLVVGTGVTGITAAYLLRNAGATGALIERERVASIDTGHTTASGKKLMWRALAAAKSPRLNGYNFEELQRRAGQQIERIETERIPTVSQAFAENMGCG